MKKNQLFYISLVVIGGIFFACSGEENEIQSKEKFEDVVALPGEDTTAREQDEFNKTKNFYTKLNYKKFLSVKKKYKYINHFAVTKTGLLFLQQSKENAFAANGKYDDRVRFGLIDELGKQLLPLNCEQISNPGFTVKDYVEFKQNGKFGLFNYVKNETIDAKYDVIYPSRIMEYVAIGEKGGKLFKIYEDGKEKALTADENPPNYYNLLKDFRYNYDSKFYGWWYKTEDFEFKLENPEYDEQFTMVMAPSYLVKLEIIPNLVNNIFVQGDSTDLEAVKQLKRNDNITTIASELYQYFGQARGFTEYSYRVSTVQKNNKVKQTVTLYAYDDYSLNVKNEYTPKVTFLSDSLIEVRNLIVTDQENEYFTFFPYQKYTKYEYYSIESDGKIKMLGQGTYPMISAILLSRGHFKGHYSRYMTEYEMADRGINPDDGMPYELITDHLSAADLQFMINELYAYKGMKFTDPELMNYFSQFSWYTPKYKNVENKLTDLEKRNIRTIKNLIKDLNSNPSKFIHEETGMVVMAG